MKKDSETRKIVVFDANAMAFAKARFAVAEKLKESDIDSIFISYSKECSKYLTEKGAKVVDIINYFEGIKLSGDVENLLTDYEKKYDVLSANLLILGDLNYTWQGRKAALEGLAKHFIFWEDFLTKNKVDFIVGGTERFIHEVPRIISKKFGVQFYVWKFPPVNNHFLLLKEHNGRWDNLNGYWEKNKDVSLTNEEEIKVVEFINGIKNRKERSYLFNRNPAVTLKEIKWFLQRAYANLFIDKMKNPYGRNFMKIARIKAAMAFRKKLAPFLYEQPRFEEKYLFYPLHIPSDAQILVKAPQFRDQLGLIDNLCHHLPMGYKIYVKEHPNDTGGTRLRLLKKIKDLPNVRLIDAKINSHDLIKNAQAIITVNSNVGWEGLLYEKPVIVLGRAFYDISGLTLNLRDFYKLPETFQKALNQKEFDREKLHRFVNAVLNSVLPGYEFHAEGFVDKFCEEENLNKIVEGFKKVLLQ